MTDTPDTFDRVIGSLHGLPDVRNTRPSTVTTVLPILGNVQTFVVQTYRDERGDTIALQMVDAGGRARIIIPPAVADAIARQRDSLTAITRRQIGKRAAEARRARGEKPFTRKRKP
ncbi:MAG TPA: hypothetical protein VGS01_09655 [Candidatus Limnocylindria bacterium]|nr:hypothetical protein [Candidatus Limnocylindria bacterium]